MSGRREVLGTLLAFLALFLIDAALFRTRFYTSLLEPETTTGQMETVCYLETHRRPERNKQVLAFGDSRMGLQPYLTKEVCASRNYEFANAAIPGTSPRCWYYQVRDVDPEAHRYEALLLPVDSYDDLDWEDDPADATVDLRYLIARLRLADVLDFSVSFPTWPSRWLAFRGSLLKGTVYKDDFHAFLLDPEARRAKLRLFRRGAASWVRGFSGSQKGLNGLSVDWVARKITFPADSSPEECKVIESALLKPPAPQNGRQAAYRREWFGRIVDRYRGTGTRVLFFRLPRGPVLRPDASITRKTSSIREFASSPGVLLLDEHIFDFLERPEFFQDLHHLNAKGIALFSRVLAERVMERLSAPAAPGL